MGKKPKDGMVPRTQIKALLDTESMMARRVAAGRGGLFPLPRDIIEHMKRLQSAENSEINQALHYAANATKEDVAELLTMLDKNPELLLEAGNVVTPGGLDCRRVTIYEFCLGAGDPELAAEVQKHFAKLPSPVAGEAERQRQYDLYKPHIDGMLQQKPYDFTSLLKALKKASQEDVQALRDGDLTHKSELRDALLQFRKDHAPKMLLQPGMHYNYASLQKAFELIDTEWDALKAASNDNYNKLDFFAVLAVGFLQRRLPGIDRCIFAQGLYQIVEENTPVARTLKYTHDGGSLDPTPSDVRALGEAVGRFDLAAVGELGFKNYAWLAGGCATWGPRGRGRGGVRGGGAGAAGKLLSSKNNELTALARPYSQAKAPPPP